MEEDARITIDNRQLDQMLTETSVGYHEELFIDVAGNGVRMLGGNPGAVAGTFTNYDTDWFVDIDGSCEAYINVEEVKDYLSIIGTDMAEVVQVVFESNDDNRLSQQMRIVSNDSQTDFEIMLMLPSGSGVLQAIPTGIPQLFTDDEYHGPEAMTEKTTIETFVSELSKIEEAVSLQDGIEYYPIVVQNGCLEMSVGSERSQKVSAKLRATVEGPDVNNHHRGHFPEIIKSLSGELTIQLGDDHPMALVQTVQDRTIRHVIGNVKIA